MLFYARTEDRKASPINGDLTFASPESVTLNRSGCGWAAISFLVVRSGLAPSHFLVALMGAKGKKEGKNPGPMTWE